MNNITKEALNLFFGNGLIAKISKYWHVSPSQYDEIKRLNDMTESELRTLDLNKLSEAELSYLYFSDLLDKEQTPYSNCHNPDFHYVWSKRIRSVFDMSRLLMVDFDKTDGYSTTI